MTDTAEGPKWEEADELTPIMEAIQDGRYSDAMGLIMNATPDEVNAQDSLGRTPLHYAAHYDARTKGQGKWGRPCALIEGLAARKADFDVYCNNGQTPFDLASTPVIKKQIRGWWEKQVMDRAQAPDESD